MTFDARQFILDKRAEGTPDSEIYDSIRTTGVAQEPQQRTGVGELLPSIFAVGGGTVGGIIGGPPGAIAGAVGGGAVGEAVQQKIEKKFGEREKISPGQIAATGAISGALEATGALAFKLGGKAIQMTKPKFVSLLSKVSGFADDVIERAFTRTTGAVKGAKEGESALNEIVKSSATKFTAFARESARKSAVELNRIIKETPLPKTLTSSLQKLKGVRTKIIKKSGDFVESTTRNLRSKHNIGANKTGLLNFEREIQPSRIVSTSERGAVQSAFDSLRSVRNNMSLKHVNSILERMIVLRSKTPSGTPTGPETKAVIGEMIDDLNKFIQKVYPQSYTDFLQNNLKQRVLINEGKELFGSTSNPSPKEVSQMATRLLQIFNSGKTAIKEATEEIGEKIGEDVVGTAAGTLIKTGEQVSVRAPQLTERGIIDQAIQFIPREAVRNFIKTGNITGDFLTSSTVKLISQITGKTIKVVALELLNLAASKTTGEPTQTSPKKEIKNKEANVNTSQPQKQPDNIEILSEMSKLLDEL